MIHAVWASLVQVALFHLSHVLVAITVLSMEIAAEIFSWLKVALVSRYMPQI